MTIPILNPAAEAMTDAFFEIFSFHGNLIAFGDRLVGEFGLTSARWQIMGVVVRKGPDLTVPQIARYLGLSRQAVQRVVNDMTVEGYFRLDNNPHHKRAKLVHLTDWGQDIYDRALTKYNNWANKVARLSNADEIRKAISVLRELDGHCQILRERQD